MYREQQTHAVIENFDKLSKDTGLGRLTTQGEKRVDAEFGAHGRRLVQHRIVEIHAGRVGDPDDGVELGDHDGGIDQAGIADRSAAGRLS